jgi:uroporphyrinogen decarboxylase
MIVPLEDPQPDYERFRRSVMRDGPTDRIAAGEQHADLEIMAVVLGKDEVTWQPADHVEFQHRMGYDYVNVLVIPSGDVFGANHELTTGERSYVNEQSGPVQNWDDFERFQWPQADEVDLSAFDLCRPLLPGGMKMNAFVSCGYFAKVTWTVGLQPFCYLLMDDRPLVKAIFDKWAEWVVGVAERCMDREDVAAFWMSDDLGFNTGAFLSPADLREFIFPVYAELGRMCHARDLPFILHSCGNLNSILGDIADCGVNCLHSLPPGLYDLAKLKRDWGHKLAFSGNVDLNILGLGTEADVRQAVQRVKQVWATDPVGGILLSSSNSIANYAKVENYLTMMNEMLGGQASD